MGKIAGFIGSLFASDKLTDTAIDGLRKLGGLDAMTDQEKAKFVLDYLELTKHQSPVRRLIALSLTGLYALFIVSWLLSAAIGYYFNFDDAINFAGAVKVFMENIILTPFNLVLSFYFVINIAQKMGK